MEVSSERVLYLVFFDDFHREKIGRIVVFNMFGPNLGALGISNGNMYVCRHSYIFG